MNISCRLSVVAVVTCFLVSGCTTGQTVNDDIISLLPQNGELDPWQTQYEPARADGENLYQLINGGAEVYHEYGFQEAIAQEYRSGTGKSINLEIFRMKTPESALGMFAHKTGVGGKTVAIGDEARLESYYLNFRNREYLVTVTGFDDEKETIEGILGLARIVDKKLKIH